MREKQPIKTRNQLVVFLLLFENTSFSKGLKSNNLGSILWVDYKFKLPKTHPETHYPSLQAIHIDLETSKPMFNRLPVQFPPSSFGMLLSLSKDYPSGLGLLLSVAIVQLRLHPSDASVQLVPPLRRSHSTRSSYQRRSCSTCASYWRRSFSLWWSSLACWRTLIVSMICCNMGISSSSDAKAPYLVFLISCAGVRELVLVASGTSFTGVVDALSLCLCCDCLWPWNPWNSNGGSSTCWLHSDDEVLESTYILECSVYSVWSTYLVVRVSGVRIYGLKWEGVNCLRKVSKIFLKFNKILCMNPEQKSG